ncbi:hypothetical protein ADU59_11555 [Pararhizobium polonicum]|uniref:Uncharacterized protein n=1 Tax=Pararhizobium polonicum TaxID=1612624 RepID=A0A1C7P1T4_9HYPH|nr:hypothetical protein ADU59_11555 [Pararhizobium polonicum]
MCDGGNRSDVVAPPTFVDANHLKDGAGQAAGDWHAAYLGLTLSGSVLRLVSARSFSSFSDMDFSMLLEAPLRSDFFVSPRFADRAAPAAFCWAWDFAGIVFLLQPDAAC